MEPVIVVTGKPAAASASKIHWIKYLMVLNFMLFVYHCTIEDYSHTNDFVFFFMTYALYGIYLPLYGLRCLSENKPPVLFVAWQFGLSAFHLMSSIFVIVLYYGYEQMCRECLDVFKSGHETCETTWLDNPTEVQLDKCMEMPDEDSFLTKHGAATLVSLVGIITAYKVSKADKKTTTVEAVQVTDPEIIAQILEHV